MSDKDSGTYVNEATSGMSDAMKAVPSLIVLAALSFLLLRYAFDRWALLAELSAVDRGSLASLLAPPLALIIFFLGNYWDEHVFDPLYSVDPRRDFRGKFLDRSRRSLLGLLPAGTVLDGKRKEAVKALNLSTEEGVYGAAKERLVKTAQWQIVGRLLFLSKLCRSLIWPSFLVGAGLLTNGSYLLAMERRIDTPSLAGALAFILFGVLLFVPYINLRVEHMVLLYRRASAKNAC